MKLRVWYRSSLLVCGLLLVLLLAACGGSGSSGSATPTSAPAASPTPSPTPAPSLTTYTGNGYSIGYPSGWKTRQSGNLVIFADPSGLTSFVVGVTPNPEGAVPPSTALNGGVATFKNSSKNYKPVNMAPTLTLAGETWNQQAATGDYTQSGQTANLEIVALATNHPARASSTKLFFIDYTAPSQLFDQANSTTFQPMLHSFKFLS